MNNYIKNYEKYKKIAMQQIEDIEVIQKLLDENSVEREFNNNRNAIILLGFSGNGKTKYRNDILSIARKKNLEYKVLSIDDIILTIRNVTGKKETVENVLNAINYIIDRAVESDQNIICDGNYLSILTRQALIDTLHEYGYTVTMVDLTDNINKTIYNRIKDATEKRLFEYSILGKEVNKKEIFDSLYREIINFYKKEKEISNIDEQKLYKLHNYKVDKYLTYEDNLEDALNLETEYQLKKD